MTDVQLECSNCGHFAFQPWWVMEGEKENARPLWLKVRCLACQHIGYIATTGPEEVQWNQDISPGR